MHPCEGGRKLYPGLFGPVSRRDFLRGSARVAAGLPLASAVLAACKNPTKSVSGGGPSGSINPALELARPDHPVTLPVDSGMMIKSGQDTSKSALAGTKLKVYNWVDYVSPRCVNKLFPEQTGISVEVTTFNTISEAVSKLTTANLDFDVLMGVGKDILGRLVAAGLLRPLNHDYLPNLQNLWPMYSTPEGAFYDVGQQYTVPYTVFTTGIAYRVDKGPTSHIRMDLSPLETQIPAMSNPYEIFWDTTYKGYTNLLDDYRDVPTMVLLKNGANSTADVNTDDPSTRQADLLKMKTDLLECVHTVNPKFDNEDYTELPEATCYIHQAWSGDIATVKWYYPGWSDKHPIRYWYPPDGRGAVGGDHMSILVNGKNPLAAHVFLNWMLDVDNAMVNFVWMGYPPPLKQIASPEQLTTDSTTPLRGKYGNYNAIPPELANAIPLEDQYKQGFAELELSPEVDNEWKQIYEAAQTA